MEVCSEIHGKTLGTEGVVVYFGDTEANQLLDQNVEVNESAAIAHVQMLGSIAYTIRMHFL